MKKVLFVLAPLLMCSLAPVSQAATAEKPEMAVLDFRETPQTAGLGSEAAEALNGELWGGIFHATPWTVLSRRQLAGRLAGTQKYMTVERYRDAQELLDTARQIGVRYLVYGGLGDFVYVQELRKAKKTIQVGTGRYETQRVRKYVVAGPKIDRQVEIMTSADVDTMVVHSRSLLRVSFGVLDTATGQAVFERVLEESGEYDDAAPTDMARSLMATACRDFVAELKKNAGPGGEIVSA